MSEESRDSRSVSDLKHLLVDLEEEVSEAHEVTPCLLVGCCKIVQYACFLRLMTYTAQEGHHQILCLNTGPVLVIFDFGKIIQSEIVL